VPSALWISYAVIQGRILFDAMGWREVVVLAPPAILAVVILAIIWVLDRWPAKGNPV
jgi:hypothetical protein